MTNWQRLLELKAKLNMKVEGLENYPKDNASLIVANHNCLMDIFYLPAALETPTISLISARLIYKNEPKRKKTVNELIYPLPIEAHGGGIYTNLCLNAAYQMIAQGYSVSIFLEGAYLSPSNFIYRGRTGMTRILFNSRDMGINLNLVPIAIKIDSENLILDNFIPTKDKITIKILEPISYDTEYQNYKNSQDFIERNNYLHQVANKSMLAIANALEKNFNPNYIQLNPKRNVIFQNGEIVDTMTAQKNVYVTKYQQELKEQIKSLKRNLEKEKQ